MSGGPKTPLVVKAKRTSLTKNTASFRSEDGTTVVFSGSEEDAKYFRPFDEYVITFQPVVPSETS